MNNLQIKEIPAVYFILFTAIILLASFLGKLPGGMVGGFALTMALGYAFEYIGDRVPIVNTYLGGGPIVCIFAGAALVYWGVLPEAAIKTVDDFMTDGGFLTFYIVSLIVGSIFGIEARLLLKAGARFAVPVLMALVFAMIFCAIVAFVLGLNSQESIANVVYPILGGGLGAGVLPIAEIYQLAANLDTEDILGILIPPMALGNVFAIIAGGLLYRLSLAKPSLSGNGNLLKGENTIDAGNSTEDDQSSYGDLATGILASATMAMVGGLLTFVISGVHEYALMIIAVVLLKLAGIVPDSIQKGCSSWFKFMAKYMTPALLVGIGMSYTDLGLVIDALNVHTVLLVLAVVVGAVVGAGLGGLLVGFHFIESSLAAGLCMANMGGTGDVAVLSAARRMNLIPFAQIASRLGGALILIVVGITIPFLVG